MRSRLEALVSTPIASAAASLLLVVLASASMQLALGLDVAIVYRASAAFVLLGAAVAWVAGRHALRRDFGAANRITLARAALVVVLAGCALEPGSAALAWCVIALSIVVLVLDGVDGRLARQRGTASAFGARFDMEVDALLILVLATLAWQFGKAGPWVLAAGLMRYCFVFAGTLLPALQRPLPYSRRRQTVCVVQIVSLLVCLAPFIARPWSSLAALAGVATLTASFATDIAWLARRAH